MSTIEVELTLANARAVFTPLKLELPEDLAVTEWADIGRKLARSSQVLTWWLGDWAAFGERKYGQLKEFANGNGINYQTLRDAAWVSRAVPMSRRRDNLEWSTHREVAALAPKEQAHWLDRIEKESLTRGDLRRQIRLSRGDSSALQSEGQTLEMGTKYFEDLLGWLKAQPDDFWTQTRRQIWAERLLEIEQFRQRLL